VAKAQTALAEARAAAATARRDAEARRLAETKASDEARRASQAANGAVSAVLAYGVATGASAAKDAEQRLASEGQRAAEALRRAEQAVKAADDTVRMAAVQPSPPPAPVLPKVAQQTPPQPATVEKRPSTRNLAPAPVPPVATQASAKPRQAKVRRVAAARTQPACRNAGQRIRLPGWYVIRGGDTLWNVAFRHYGEGGRYGLIHKSNVRRIANADVIRPCQRIWLPRR
jgi:nucleoid-associated protein YgaU